MKLGILISNEQSLWKSCNFISANLIQAYKCWNQNKKAAVEWIRVCPQDTQLDLRMGTGYVRDLAAQIFRLQVTDLVFLDHHVDPVPLLMALRTVDVRKFRQMRFTFHIYGDFSLTPQRWLDVGKLLTNLKTKFICASERQKQLVAFFEPKEQSVAEVCPFPVNSKLFQFNEKARRSMRKKLKLNEADTLMLYTGRISMQKGVLRLIEEFTRLVESGRKNLYLAIAGGIDDLAGLTSGIEIPAGFFFHHLQEQLELLPKRVLERIFMLGELDTAALRPVYCAADLFTSFSLYHDEDFGMAPAEALACGLPSVLTAWGGYAAFGGEGIPSYLVPVQLNKRGLQIDAQSLEQGLAEALSASAPAQRSAQKRLAAGKAFAKKFGVEAVATRIGEIFVPETFRPTAGFYWSLEVVRDKASTMTGDLYRDVYERYVQ